MIQPEIQWSFTDQPDMFRICRELRDAGCCVGLVTRADGAITLVDASAERFQAFPSDRAAWEGVPDQFPIFAGWICLKGDHLKAVLKVSPVAVRGYK